MTRNVKLIGILLLLLIAGSGCRFMHRDLKEKMERAQIKRHANLTTRRQMNHGGRYMYNAPMNGRRGAFGQGAMRGMRGDMQMPMYGMGRGRGQMGMNFMGRGPMGPGNMIGRIPNLTEKQRKDIADLRQKEMDEMLKFREETSVKVQDMREAYRKKIMNLLTEEQKKFLESGAAVPNPPPAQVPAPVK
jgi:hypothetical protein